MPIFGALPAPAQPSVVMGCGLRWRGTQKKCRAFFADLALARRLHPNEVLPPEGALALGTPGQVNDKTCQS